MKKLPLLSLLLPLLPGLFSSTASASLSVEIENFLHTQAQAYFPDATLSARLLPLDPRLHLAPCDKPTFALRSQRPIGRVSVNVRCTSPKPWAIYLPGEIQVTREVVVVRSGIERGMQINSSVLVLEERDLSKVRANYLTKLEDAVGFETVRRLQTGSVVYSNLLKEPLIIKRGERVTIQAGSGAITINAVGEALQDGTQGQQIRIRNLQSKKVVHAWVRAKGLVATQSVSNFTKLR